MNLVIHELLISVKTDVYLIFDWGSQSIAQSKFQRAKYFSAASAGTNSREPLILLRVSFTGRSNF